MGPMNSGSHARPKGMAGPSFRFYAAWLKDVPARKSTGMVTILPRLNGKTLNPAINHDHSESLRALLSQAISILCTYMLPWVLAGVCSICARDAATWQRLALFFQHWTSCMAQHLAGTQKLDCNMLVLCVVKCASAC